MTTNTQKIAKILDGKLCASKIREYLKSEIAQMKTPPQLTVIIVGENPASQIYVKNKSKYASEVGIKSDIIHLPSTVTEAELLSTIDKRNIGSITITPTHKRI